VTVNGRTLAGKPVPREMAGHTYDGDAGFFGDLDPRLLRRPRLERPETCLDLRALRFEERRE
jgi:hypothetical protein